LDEVRKRYVARLTSVATGIATGRRTEKENEFKKDLESPP